MTFTYNCIQNDTHSTKEWKAAMTKAHRIAAAKTGHCASQNRESYNKRARSSALKPGDRLLVKNVSERGGLGKLRSFWEDKIYAVDSRKGLDSFVYEVHPESDPSCKRVLHRNLLLPCPFLPYEAISLTTKPSAVVKREQSTKKVKCEDRFALPMSEFKIPDDYEDDLPTFLLSQLDQVCQQFMQSEVNMADQVAPLASVENEEPSVSSPQIVCEENQDSTRVPMTDGSPESQEMLQIPDTIESEEDALSTLESLPQHLQCSRRPPNVLSYYGLGTSQDSRPEIYSVSPQPIPICADCLHPLITGPPVYAPATYSFQPYQNQGLPI